MALHSILGILVSLTALLAFLNNRLLRLPASIGLMALALAASLLLIALDEGLGFSLDAPVRTLLEQIDFSATLMQGLLSFLLFAAALHVDLNELRRQAGVVVPLASIGVLLSTLLVGSAAWLVSLLAGLEVPPVYCLLFGAVVAPTDPVAVIGILKGARAPHSLEMKVAGESLFNDGIAVVLFLVLAGIAAGGGEVSAARIGSLFMEEAVGGILFGALLGWISYQLLRRTDDANVEILVTLALVTGGYSLANAFHLSGPLAMVVAGLMIGNHGQLFDMRRATTRHLETFWLLMDETLNAVLFVLMGLEALLIVLRPDTVLLGLLMIPVALLARFVSVGLIVGTLRRRRSFSPGVVKILTWGGLRGGVSIALALSLPPSEHRELLLTATYLVVAFSILVQGLTIGRVVAKVFASPPSAR